VRASASCIVSSCACTHGQLLPGGPPCPTAAKRHRFKMIRLRVYASPNAAPPRAELRLLSHRRGKLSLLSHRIGNESCSIETPLFTSPPVMRLREGEIRRGKGGGRKKGGEGAGDERGEYVQCPKFVRGRRRSSGTGGACPKAEGNRASRAWRAAFMSTTQRRAGEGKQGLERARELRALTSCERTKILESPPRTAPPIQ